MMIPIRALLSRSHRAIEKPSSSGKPTSSMEGIARRLADSTADRGADDTVGERKEAAQDDQQEDQAGERDPAAHSRCYLVQEGPHHASGRSGLVGASHGRIKKDDNKADAEGLRQRRGKAQADQSGRRPNTASASSATVREDP